MADPKEHTEPTWRFPGIEHEEPYRVHVEPGPNGEMIWQFMRAREFHFGCLVAGHLDAGMVGRIKITAR